MYRPTETWGGVTHLDTQMPGFENEFQSISYVKSAHSSWYLVLLPACRTRFQLTQVSLNCMNGALLHQFERNLSVLSPYLQYVHTFQGPSGMPNVRYTWWAKTNFLLRFCRIWRDNITDHSPLAQVKVNSHKNLLYIDFFFFAKMLFSCFQVLVQWLRMV